MKNVDRHLSKKAFDCTRCECRFETYVMEFEAPGCPKCKDSEYVNNVLDSYFRDPIGDPGGPDDML